MAGVSVVIPTWNGLDLLKQFLPSILDACHCYSSDSLNPVQILIVDDASGDGTGEWLLSQGFRVGRGGTRSNQGFRDQPVKLDVIRNNSNAGFGASCNRGFRDASFDLILLLNNDVKLSRDAIDRLARHFVDNRVFAVHCSVFDMQSGELVGAGKLASFARGFIRVHGSYVESREREESSEHPLYSAFASGGAAMYDRSKLERVGGFDELLSPYYWEDVELSYRAWKRGYEVLYEPTATATHQISSTIGKLDQRRVKIIQQRNRLIFHWVHLHDPWLLASHLVWLVLLALTAPIRLQPWYLVSCAKALGLLPGVMAHRRQEKRAAKLSDRAVFAVFDRLRKDPGIVQYDRYQELVDRGIALP
jgi:GT2 family glycosyltransferase